jgi:PIN domain nuclease of toxin-antitoxin system
MAVERWARGLMQHLDTHVAIWIAAGDKRRLQPARKHLAKGNLVLSPIVVLELELMREIGRLSESVDTVLQVLFEHDVHRVEVSGPEMLKHARGLSWTRDPFDRIIAASAFAGKATLITADARLLEHCSIARWD